MTHSFPLHPHGAARVALSGPAPSEEAAPGLSPAVREALDRADVSPEEAHLAWELARLVPGLELENRHALTLLLVLVLDARAAGSTRVPLEAPVLLERALQMGATEVEAHAVTAAARQLASAPFDALFGPPGTRKPLWLADGHIYAQRSYAVEEQIGRAVATRVSSGVTPLSPERLAAALEVARGAEGRLTKEQEGAVRSALEHRLTVIAGGPGTGKTTIIVALLRAVWAAELIADPSEIALAAPTGKAADRMRQALGERMADEDREGLADRLPRPKTLHRLLRWSPSRGRFLHGPGRPIDASLVVVDETSMVDVFVMGRLLASLPEGARLILLGDSEQLPSVAAGAVFRELQHAAAVPSVTLHQSHRMNPAEPSGFNILSVAGRLNSGEPPVLVAVEGDRPATAAGVGRVEGLPTSVAALRGVCLIEAERSVMFEALLSLWFEERLWPTARREPLRRSWRRDANGFREAEALEAIFETMEEARLLCVTRSAGGRRGSDAVNAAMHRRMERARGEPSAPGRLLSGEPVVVHRNDYERGLFNGDQGMLLWTVSTDSGQTKPRLSAIFRRDDGFVAFPLESVRSGLELGYATTVHKAQGSEHEQVVLLLPENDNPRLLTREIVYTALTRARRSVVVVGKADLLGRAARRRVERTSGIGARIAEAVAATSK